jgi:hypothetical protein
MAYNKSLLTPVPPLRLVLLYTGGSVFGPLRGTRHFLQEVCLTARRKLGNSALVGYVVQGPYQICLPE